MKSYMESLTVVYCARYKQRYDIMLLEHRFNEMHGEYSLFGVAWVISYMTIGGLSLCKFSEVHLPTFKGN